MEEEEEAIEAATEEEEDDDDHKQQQQQASSSMLLPRSDADGGSSVGGDPEDDPPPAFESFASEPEELMAASATTTTSTTTMVPALPPLGGNHSSGALLSDAFANDFLADFTSTTTDDSIVVAAAVGGTSNVTDMQTRLMELQQEQEQQEQQEEQQQEPFEEDNSVQKYGSLPEIGDDDDDRGSDEDDNKQSVALTKNSNNNTKEVSMDHRWNRRYVELVEYVRHHGHARVPQTGDPIHKQLGAWVKTQRLHKRRGKLSEAQIQCLDDIDMVWDANDYKGFGGKHRQDDAHQKWMTQYQRLLEFYRREGHCKVPTKHKPLGIWTANQRQLHSKGQLSEDRRELLHAIGFCWYASSDYYAEREQAWMEQYHQLVDFVQQHGHCRISTANPNHDKVLAQWVANQRRAYVKAPDKYRPDRYQLLNEIGFVWKGQEFRGNHAVLHTTTSSSSSREGGDDDNGNHHQQRLMTWDDWYDKLVQFKRERKHTLVPSHHKKSPYQTLGMWVRRQRERYAKGILSEERIAKLQAIDFIWRVADGPSKHTTTTTTTTTSTGHNNNNNNNNNLRDKKVKYGRKK